MLKLISNTIPGFFKNFKRSCQEFKKQRMLYRLNILNLELNQNERVVLNVIVSGIKNQIIQYAPEEIVFNDSLLSEFSPCDVRAITYLSFRRNINYTLDAPILIQSQKLKRGKTIFSFLSRHVNGGTKARINGAGLEPLIAAGASKIGLVAHASMRAYV